MSDPSKNIIERMHENLLIRDITYIFSGGIFITISINTFDYDLNNYFNFITQNIYSFILFVLLSYFIGIVLNFLVPLFRILPFKIIKSKICSDTLDIYTDIQISFGNFAIKQLERILFIRNLFSTISLALILGILIDVFHSLYYEHQLNIIIIILFLILSIFFIYIARMQHESYEDSLRGFGTKLLTKKD